MKAIATTICYILLCCKISFAQHHDSVFAPMPVTLFEDNFQSDSLGTFPLHWHISSKDSVKWKRLCRVRNFRGKRTLVIRDLSYETSGIKFEDYSVFGQPAPKMSVAEYLPDSFTLEFDFLIASTSAMVLKFYATNAAPVLDIFVQNSKMSYLDLTTDYSSTGNHISTDERTLPTFKRNEWHHFGILYNRHIATCYLDGKQIVTTYPLKRDPLKFFPGNTNMPSDSIAWANFRLTTGLPSETNFTSLVNKNKFITHSIVFDVNKADIQPQSLAYVKQLADWLKRNPSIKLEIDGHTDNDGSPADNLKLSQKRADAVKDLLMSFGIHANRLATRGYGDTRPVQPNISPEGKAENRRVEFIKKS